MEKEFTILIATENKNKLIELSAILPSHINGRKVTYLYLRDLPPPTDMPEETGRTIEENAKLKALYAAKMSGILTLADDTGLEVTALNGAPGVKSARYAGPGKKDNENNLKLLHDLDGLFLGERTARFKTVAALATPAGEVKIEEGILEGLISLEARGANGFGYDPLFIVKGTNKTLAELTAEEKNKISHRRKAFEKIAKHIKTAP